jgi:hypothetical protein
MLAWCKNEKPTPPEDVVNDDILDITQDNSPILDPGVPQDAEIIASDAQVGEDVPEPAFDVGEIVTVFVDDLNDGKVGTGTEEDPYRDLQNALDEAPDGAVVQIQSGFYSAVPVDYADSGCGNCDDATFSSGATATRGYLVEDKSLHIQGAGANDTVLTTNAGYGVLFYNAKNSSIRDLVITGGKRDADGQATDAAIVVMFTTLLAEDLVIAGNDNLYTGPEPDPVVGVGGIFGREGADLTVRNCVIENNSWDGITLYRGVPNMPATAPRAHVEGCRIGCTSNCVNPRGRGVGLAATWDSQMTLIGNVVHHYWKGIGSFGDTIVYAKNNIVRDQIGWGVIASGNSTMYAHNNVVAFNGTTGMSVWNDGVSGAFINNIIIGNGTSADEWVGKKVGLWFNAAPGSFTVMYNLIWDNADNDMCTGGTPLPTPSPCTPIEYIGLDGHLAEDPLFEDTTYYRPRNDSPVINMGDPEIQNSDGSRSHMGAYGGPDAPLSFP